MSKVPKSMVLSKISLNIFFFSEFQNLLTKKTKQGIGVNLFKLIKAIDVGICPPLAPTKNSREEANMPPLTAPNVEQATKNGIIHDITPRRRFPKV